MFQANSTIETSWIDENDDAQDAWCGSDCGEPARHWPNFHPVTRHSSDEKCEEISYDDLQAGTIPKLPPLPAGKIWFWFSDHITSEARLRPFEAAVGIETEAGWRAARKRRRLALENRLAVFPPQEGLVQEPPRSGGT
ncbi:MAG: hypothetical protein JXQ71_12795, partial [Verrucomicrobia bacterium]|nr:hypothetical protein [Verrucomicrobiota bacterium]